MMRSVGYEWLQQHLDLSAFPPRLPARVRDAVRRIESIGGELSIPQGTAPGTDADAVEHALFALRHEGTNLPILAEAVRHMPAERVVAEVAKHPNGAFIRKLGYLWEHIRQETLPDRPAIGGGYVDLFDPRLYVVASGPGDGRWRVNFNGLGSIRYCVTIEKSAAIKAAMARDVLQEAREFANSLGSQLVDRALAWAYLSETRDSFAIENEVPSEGKERLFVSLLHRASENQIVNEDYMTRLHQAVMTDPLNAAVGYRETQNYLVGGLRGPSNVTYIPPPPDLLQALMPEFHAMANSLPTKIPPLVAASIIKFGFVFLHPFVDGNGRLSRFLFHQALCRSGQLERGLLLPVSVAMKAHEDLYLSALQSYSRPARERWDVRWIGGQESYEMQFNGSDAIYRYWDGTPMVEFGLQMATRALDEHLRSEVDYLVTYEQVVREINARFDVPGSTLGMLVQMALTSDELSVSKHRRKQYAETVSPEVFDAIDALLQPMRRAREQKASEPDVLIPAKRLPR